MPPAPEVKLPPGLATRYRAGRVLGSGGFGTVLLAEDLTLRRTVAIKLLHARHAADPGLLARFEREAKVAARIDSPHAARLYDHGSSDGVPYLVFQYVEGPDLERLVAGHGPLPFPRAAGILLGILAGLDAVHRAGVIHRDVKSANVILKAGDLPVLVDFGLGRGAGDETLTATGAIVGSFLHMPPDQLRGRAPAPHWDLYAAAVVLVELATGAPPFPGPDAGAILAAKDRGYAPLLARRGAAPPPGLEELLGRMLDPDPARRPGTAREAAAALRAILGLPAAAAPDPAPGPAPVAAAPTLSQVGPRFASTPIPAPGKVGPPVPRAPALLAGASALALVLAGAYLGHSVGPAAPPAPPPAAPSGPEGPDAEAARRILRGALDRLERSPEIARALALTLDTGVDQAVEIWEAGRESARLLVGRSGLQAAVERLAGLPPERETVSTAADLGLILWLLGYSSLRKSAPLFPPEHDPAPRRLLEAACRVGRDEILDRRDSEDWLANREIYRPKLAAGGRTWRTVRTYESMDVDPAHPRPDGRTREARLMMLSLAGVPFLDPALVPGRLGGVTELMAGAYRPQGKGESMVSCPREAVFPLLDPGGKDLVLALQSYGWKSDLPASLRIRGAGGAELRLAVGWPPRRHRLAEGNWVARVGMDLCIAAAVLPPPPLGISISARGIQPIVDPSECTVALEEVHQLVDGPLPPGLLASPD